ncbi:ABC transporter ATP-binding protein [Paracoccus seriniphilus]|uniref:ABC transporter ATP-binding protein n=1 Tax=Paracoccus seriniphilus TaxID=184748 RepID=UPI00356159A0
MLEIRNLSIRTRERELLSELSLSLADGAMTALIGPSGCGKTSVLKWLAGILPDAMQDSGQLLLDGAPVARPHPALCYQPQSDALFPWLTIIQNAAIGLEIAGLSRDHARQQVAPLFATFGLEGCEQMFPAQLSGGMRQRAAFLRTVVQEGRFILLDEPFSALDAVTRLRMQDWLMQRLHERPRGVLLVTHDLHEAATLADRIIVMSSGPGRIIADIPVTTPRDQRDEATLAPLRDRLKSLLLKETTT